jgi:transglutaminase-like putative cysteine protease
MGIGPFLLLLWLQLTAAWCIVSAEWTKGLEVLPGVALLALVIGYLLALSRWPPISAHLYSFTVGAATSFFSTSLLLPDTLGWQERFINLGWRIGYWLEGVRTGEARGGPIAFVLLMSLTVWWSAYLAAWLALRKRNGWLAVIPSGVLTAINAYYGPQSLAIYPIAYAFASLIFVLWLHFREQEESWAHHRVGYSPYASFDFFRYGLAFILLALAFAWLAPGAKANLKVGFLKESWEKVQREWNKLFPSLKGYRVPKIGRAYFGKELELGGPVALGGMVVLEVEAYPRELVRYWKAASYDFYTGRGWLNTDNTAFLFGAWEEIPAFRFELRQAFTQTYYLIEPEGRLIYAAAQPSLLSEKAFIIATGEGDRIEPSLLLASEPLKPGAVVRVVSQVSVADEESLRKAGTDYPAWIARYLQLPADLPQRVKDLALEITSRYDNPYDKALAIERYLRENIVYNEKVPPPPEGRDAVDYFLFDLRQGYCNYYASAMVVMARAVGIPARLVAGYTAGEYLAEKGRWRVREKNAHAWVEVFFPRYGWVEFEPTSVQLPIVRVSRTEGETRPLIPRERPLRIPEGVEVPEESKLPPPAPPPQAFALPSPERFKKFWPLVPGLAALMMGLRVIQLKLEPPELRPASRLYLRLLRLGWLAGIKARPSQTPLEYLESLTKLFPEKAEPFRKVVCFYLQERFSPEPPDEEVLLGLEKELSLRVLLASLKGRYGFLGNKEKRHQDGSGPNKHR